jgi:hypothetical protein
LAAVVGSVIVCGTAWTVFAVLLARIEPDLRAAIVKRLRRDRS